MESTAHSSAAFPKYRVLTPPAALQYVPVNPTKPKELSLLLGGQEGETSERGQAEGWGQRSRSPLQGNLCATSEAEPPVGMCPWSK